MVRTHINRFVILAVAGLTARGWSHPQQFNAHPKHSSWHRANSSASSSGVISVGAIEGQGRTRLKLSESGAEII